MRNAAYASIWSRPSSPSRAHANSDRGLAATTRDTASRSSPAASSAASTSSGSAGRTVSGRPLERCTGWSDIGANVGGVRHLAAIESDQLKQGAMAVLVIIGVVTAVVARFVTKIVSKLVLLALLIAVGFGLWSQRDDL